MSEKEFEKLFRDHFTPMCNLAFTVVKDADVAKDIVQQVFVKLWQKKDHLNIRTAFRPYLYRAVVNTALNHIKNEKKISSIDSIKEKAEVREDESKENIENKVHEAIRFLPPVCQKVFRLSRFSDLTNRQIADELNISVKAVEKHITRAMKILRIRLRPLITSENIFFILFFLSEVGFYHFFMSINR